MDCEGKVAVITGAGRGIGRGIALHCARQSMRIVLAGIGLESLERTEAELQELGTETLVVRTDVSLLEDVNNLAERAFSAFGSVHLLVNNAGVAVPTSVASVLQYTMDDWNWLMGVNFYGVLHGIKAFTPRLIEQDVPSHIVGVASLAGLATGSGPYSVSKHAVVVLMETLYRDLATSAPHVGVSVYCPGWVNTEFYRTGDSRPSRFRSNATLLTDEQRSRWQARLEKGVTVEEAARVLFQGLRDRKLYIGPQAFLDQAPELPNAIRTRAENIISEQNPDSPA